MRNSSAPTVKPVNHTLGRRRGATPGGMRSITMPRQVAPMRLHGLRGQKPKPTVFTPKPLEQAEMIESVARASRTCGLSCCEPEMAVLR